MTTFILFFFLQDTTYKMCNAYLDESRFPPFLPNGEFRFDADIRFNDEIIANLALYLKIYRPIPYPRKPKIVY